MLTQCLNVSFTKDPPAHIVASTCLIYQRKSTKPCNEVKICSDGVHRIKRENRISAQSVSESSRVNTVDLACKKCCAFSEWVSQLDQALEWHKKTVHPHTNRYMKLSSMFDDVTKFPRQLFDEILCVPCRLAKMQRRSIQPSGRIGVRALELVHVGITGKTRTISLGSSCYGISFEDDYIAK